MILEVKIYSSYKEKFGLSSYTPSLLAPGNCATQGIVVVTASGTDTIGLKVFYICVGTRAINWCL